MTRRLCVKCGKTLSDYNPWNHCFYHENPDLEHGRGNAHAFRQEYNPCVENTIEQEYGRVEDPWEQSMELTDNFKATRFLKGKNDE